MFTCEIILVLKYLNVIVVVVALTIPNRHQLVLISISSYTQR